MASPRKASSTRTKISNKQASKPPASTKKPTLASKTVGSKSTYQPRSKPLVKEPTHIRQVLETSHPPQQETLGAETGTGPVLTPPIVAMDAKLKPEMNALPSPLSFWNTSSPEQKEVMEATWALGEHLWASRFQLFHDLIHCKDPTHAVAVSGQWAKLRMEEMMQDQKRLMKAWQDILRTPRS